MRILKIAGLALFGAAVVYAAAQTDDLLKPGDKVEFEARTLGDEAIASEALRGGVTLLLLWGPWSERGGGAAIDAAARLREDFEGREVRFVALACWENLANVRSFVEEREDLGLEVWWDPAGKSTADSLAVKVFKTRRFPTVYVLDRDLTVVGAFTSLRPSGNDEVVAAIEKALGR